MMITIIKYTIKILNKQKPIINKDFIKTFVGLAVDVVDVVGDEDGGKNSTTIHPIQRPNKAKSKTFVQEERDIPFLLINIPIKVIKAKRINIPIKACLIIFVEIYGFVAILNIPKHILNNVKHNHLSACDFTYNRINKIQKDNMIGRSKNRSIFC